MKIFEACEENEIGFVRKYKGNLNIKNDQGQTLLFAAINCNSLKLKIHKEY